MITVCVPLTESKFYSLPIFAEALLAQKFDLKQVRLILVTDYQSPRVWDGLMRWRESAAAILGQITVLQHAIPAPVPFLEQQSMEVVWTISHLRQRGLEEYVRLPDDEGLVWWDSDHAWSENFLARVTGCGHPVATGMYVARAGSNLCHFYQDPQERILTVLPELAAETPFNLYNGLGGFYASRALWETFAARGGWTPYRPIYGPPFWNGCEDFWCCHQIGVAARFLPDVSCRHYSEDGHYRIAQVGADGVCCVASSLDAAPQDSVPTSRPELIPELVPELIPELIPEPRNIEAPILTDRDQNNDAGGSWPERFACADAEARMPLIIGLVNDPDAVGLLPTALAATNEYNRIEASKILPALAVKFPHRLPELMRLAGHGLWDTNVHVRSACFKLLRENPAEVETAYEAVRAERIAALPPGEYLTDALDRVAVSSPWEIRRCHTCLIVAASPGYESAMNAVFESVTRFGDVPEITLAALVINGDAACREVVARHNAIEIPCTSLAPMNAALKGALYSVTRFIEAERYIVCDADLLVVDSLRPILDRIDRDPHSIHTFFDIALIKEIGQQLKWSYFLEAEDDLPFLSGADDLDWSKVTLSNVGVMGGSRDAWLALDAALERRRARNVLWIDEGRVFSRDEFVVVNTLVQMGRLSCGPTTFNSVLREYAHVVQTQDGRVVVTTEFGKVHIVHFATPEGRREMGTYMQHLGIPGGENIK